ncbi:hypothetical protein EB796_007977 [Bugula neritina]|uniref:Uncharacterized protein n=1 Tax=Bugula neritina TaxID=10212 RepID=A0A7J7K4Z1_BUGNE|nr:hypothetical protein EB796_007977 [Bugula neritina]
MNIRRAVLSLSLKHSLTQSCAVLWVKLLPRRHPYSTLQSCDNIKIEVVHDKLEKWEKLLDLWLYHFANAPVTSNIGAFRTDDGKIMLKGLLKDSLAYDNSPCVVAWDTHRNKAAGFILNHTFHVNQALEKCGPPIPYSNYSWDKQWLQPIQDLEHYKHYVSMSSIFARLQVRDCLNMLCNTIFYRYKKIMKAQIGCTGPDYTNQKVMSRLYQKGVEQVQACKGVYDAIVGGEH